MQTSIFDKPKVSQKDKILNLLKSKPSVSMRELNDIAFRYSARIYDLRKDGHVIEEERLPSGEWFYSLGSTTLGVN